MSSPDPKRGGSSTSTIWRDYGPKYPAESPRKLHGLTLNITTDPTQIMSRHGIEHIALDTDDYSGMARLRATA
jgi:hypothetical protein